jgi:uncharacterized protein
MRHEVQSSLLELAGQGREVWLMLLGQDSGFQSHELDQFAGSIDLVEIRAAGRHYYRGVPETLRVESEPVSSPEPLSAVASEDDDQLGAIGYALAQQAPGALQVPKSDPQGDPELLSEPEPEPIELSTQRLNDEQRPCLILIDAENVDSVLYEIIGDSRKLTSETRVQWARLQEWAAAEHDMGTVHVVPVLQATSPAMSGFASHLAGLGFRPVLLAPYPERKVVDEAIMKLLEDMQTRYGNVMLVSNDGDFYDHLDALGGHPDGSERVIYVAGFVDRMSQKYRKADWIEVLDLERDLSLFGYQLPNRYLAQGIDQFDAAALLNESGLFEEFDEDNDIEAA